MPRLESPRQRRAYHVAAAATLSLLALALVEVVVTSSHLGELRDVAALSLAVLGKFIILKGLDPGSHLGPLGIALVVVTIDMVLCLVLTSGIEQLERLPVIGLWLRYARRRARRALDENPGLDNMAFYGVALLVFLPLAATGAITGTLAARMLGLSRFAGWCAVLLGSLGISTAFAGLTYAFRGRLSGDQPLVLLVFALGVAAVAIPLARRARRILRGDGGRPADASSED